MKKAQGFTLIELVVVIVILGILAATALPKFVDLTTDARKGKAQAALGSIKSAAALSHAASLVASSNNVTIEGTAYVLVNGYPAASDIVALAGLTDYAPQAVAAGAIQIYVDASHANCKVTYTQAGAGGAPTYALDISSC